MRGLVIIGALAGCGRLGFDTGTIDGSRGDGGGDGDGSDPSLVTLRVGNRGDADVAGIADTYLSQAAPDTNQGGSTRFVLIDDSDRPALLRFELGGLVQGTVVSATLHIWVASDVIRPDVSVDLFRMHEAWTEGTGSFEPGVANVTERMVGTAWTTANAGAPGSRDATPFVRAMGPANVGADFAIPLPIAVVTEWVTDPLTNFGVAVFLEAGSGDYSEVSSSDNSNELVRPLLVIETRL